MWEPHLREWLPHVGGVGGGGDFSNLALFSHTDLGRKGDFPERFRRIAELADAVVIDEAHHFRNPGRRGDPDRGIEPSRYHRMFDLLDQSDRPKTVFMLTATPINNRLSDFRHMAELFTRRDEQYFARTVGVNHLTAHFNRMEKVLRARAGTDGAPAQAVLEVDDAQDILGSDAIFRELVVQRSRAYARESQMQEHGEAAAFPERKAPHAYEGTRTSVEEMHLEYQALLRADLQLEARLAAFPGQIFSGRRRPARGTRGVFFCYALPGPDRPLGGNHPRSPASHPDGDGAAYRRRPAEGTGRMPCRSSPRHRRIWRAGP